MYVHQQNKFLGWLSKTEKYSPLPAQSAFLRIFENVAKNSHGWPGYRKNVSGIICSVNNVLYNHKIILLVLPEISNRNFEGKWQDFTSQGSSFKVKVSPKKEFLGSGSPSYADFLYNQLPLPWELPVCHPLVVCVSFLEYTISPFLQSRCIFNFNLTHLVRKSFKLQVEYNNLNFFTTVKTLYIYLATKSLWRWIEKSHIHTFTTFQIKNHLVTS